MDARGGALFLAAPRTLRAGRAGARDRSHPRVLTPTSLEGYNPGMDYITTILHIQDNAPEAVEEALTAIFGGEERPRVLRLEGTYNAVLARANDPNLDASYRYLICRPNAAARWTPVLELGERADGLDVELSRALDGAAVFTVFAYDDGVSGYRLAR